MPVSDAHSPPSDDSANLEPARLRSAFALFPTGVIAVAAMQDEDPKGLAASSFTSVSLDPPLVSVCMALTSTTWPQLRRAPVFGLSVLANTHGPTARAFAAKDIDRFADVTWEKTDDGAVFVHGSVIWIEAVIHQEIPAGDHEIVLLRVRRLWTYPDVAPLVFHASKFRELNT